jgi:hypothetical protein
VHTKDSYWSVGTIYDPRELPGVSTAGPGIGRGVTAAAAEAEAMTKECGGRCRWSGSRCGMR